MLPGFESRPTKPFNRIKQPAGPSVGHYPFNTINVAGKPKDLWDYELAVENLADNPHCNRFMYWIPLSELPKDGKSYPYRIEMDRDEYYHWAIQRYEAYKKSYYAGFATSYYVKPLYEGIDPPKTPITPYADRVKSLARSLNDCQAFYMRTQQDKIVRDMLNSSGADECRKYRESNEKFGCSPVGEAYFKLTKPHEVPMKLPKNAYVLVCFSDNSSTLPCMIFPKIDKDGVVHIKDNYCGDVNFVTDRDDIDLDALRKVALDYKFVYVCKVSDVLSIEMKSCIQE